MLTEVLKRRKICEKLATVTLLVSHEFGPCPKIGASSFTVDRAAALNKPDHHGTGKCCEKYELFSIILDFRKGSEIIITRNVTSEPNFNVSRDVANEKILHPPRFQVQPKKYNLYR